MNKFLLMKERGDTILFSDLLAEIPDDDVLRELMPNPYGPDKRFITHRGMKVLKLRLDGLRQTEIAEQLNMTPGQVAYVSAEIKNCLYIAIPSYIDIDIPALRKILRLNLKEPSGYTRLSDLLRDMPSDDELKRLYAERGHVIRKNSTLIPTHQDLQLLQLRINGNSYESIGAEFHMDGKKVQHQISLTLERLWRSMDIELDVPALSKPRKVSFHKPQESPAPISRPLPIKEEMNRGAITKRNRKYILFPITRDEVELIIRALSQYQKVAESGFIHKTRNDLAGEIITESQIIANLYGRAELAVESNSLLELLLAFEKNYISTR